MVLSHLLSGVLRRRTKWWNWKTLRPSSVSEHRYVVCGVWCGVWCVVWCVVCGRCGVMCVVGCVVWCGVWCVVCGTASCTRLASPISCGISGPGIPPRALYQLHLAVQPNQITDMPLHHLALTYCEPMRWQINHFSKIHPKK